MTRFVAMLLAALCGGCVVLSLAPFDIWPLSIAAAAGLFWILEAAPQHAARIGIAFGVAKYLFGTSWVYVSINVYGNAPPPLAAFLVLLMVIILSTFVWLQWYAYGVMRREVAVANGALFVGLWVVGEWLMTWVLSGFPWLFIGYAHLDSVLAGFAPVGGVLLVSLVACASGVLVVLMIRGAGTSRWLALASVVVLFALGAVLQQVSWTTPQGLKSAALVQGNTPQATKWDPDQRQPIVRNHMQLSEPHWGADVVLWPESAITVPEHNAELLLSGLDRQARASGTAFVTGLPVLERHGDGYAFYNSVLALGRGEGRYIKQHLVPFGEYVPFESLLRGAIEFFDLPMSGLQEGDAAQPNLELGGFQGAMLICYEIAFGGLTREQAAGAHVLMTVSNDTWFGESIGPSQHMQIARMRSVELGRWMLRATNNGISAIVDPKGQVVATMPQFTSGVVTGEFQPMVGLTPYQRFGGWPVVALLAMLLALARMVRQPMTKREEA